MKKLIALTFCLAVAAVAVRAEYPKTEYPQQNAMAERMEQQVTQQVKAAQQQPKQPASITIPGPKRLLTVRLELQQPTEDERYMEHRYWYCPAVIFNKSGALAFDGECWKAFTEAAKLPVGPVVHFYVDFGKLGDYTRGDEAGREFYFESTYVDGEGDEYTHGIAEAFKLSADQTYITYRLSLFNDPKNENNQDNSEVKQAIARYYQQNNLQEVNAQTLSKYFRQKHPTTKTELTRSYFAR